MHEFALFEGVVLEKSCLPDLMEAVLFWWSHVGRPLSKGVEFGL